MCLGMMLLSCEPETVQEECSYTCEKREREKETLLSERLGHVEHVWFATKSTIKTQAKQILRYMHICGSNHYLIILGTVFFYHNNSAINLYKISLISSLMNAVKDHRPYYIKNITLLLRNIKKNVIEFGLARTDKYVHHFKKNA